MQIKPKSPGTEIEHVEFDGPERFVVTGGGMSYVVFPSGSGVTSGDVDAVSRCPAPNCLTDGSVVRVSTIHDAFASVAEGNAPGSKWISRLQIVSAVCSEFPEGSYVRLENYGAAPRLQVPNPANPAFFGVFEDVTDEFVRQANDEQLQARIDIGRVYQRLCVDADPGRVWTSGVPAGIVFAGNVAPALDSISPRERRGLLLEAGFEGRSDFAARCFQDHAQTPEEAGSLLSGETIELPKPGSEALDYCRMHTDESVQDSCYVEMVGDAVAALAASPTPENLPGLNRTASPGLSA